MNPISGEKRTEIERAVRLVNGVKQVYTRQREDGALVVCAFFENRRGLIGRLFAAFDGDLVRSSAASLKIAKHFDAASFEYDL